MICFQWASLVIQAIGVFVVYLYVRATFESNRLSRNSNKLSREAIDKAEKARLKESMPQILQHVKRMLEDSGERP